ncbi:MAG: transporter substrate-binding domain-containing protein [Candidatus Deferrimicrobiaceae bacterium]
MASGSGDAVLKRDRAFVIPGIAGIVAVLLLLTGFSHQALAAAKPELLVAISLDIPPFVMDKAAGGIEVDIVRQALKDYRLRFIQLPYEELQKAVQQKRVDVSVGVQPGDKGVYYSADFINFVNYAISKKSDGLRIDSVADLRDHQVLTWENAYLELGSEFEAMFSSQSPQRKNYIEVADQKEQVRKFWEGKGLVIVIDRSIFSYFSRKMGHEINTVSFHAIFPPVTNFKVGFQDVTVRNRFNEGLSAMCGNGEYAGLLHRYGVVVKQTVCE